MKKNIVYLLVAVIAITSMALVLIPQKAEATSIIGAAFYGVCYVQCERDGAGMPWQVRLNWVTECQSGCNFYLIL